jgi:hypothetical protein
MPDVPWFANPKGIATSSPRLARSAYLGFTFRNGNNANGVATFSPTLRQRRYVG